MIKQPKLESAIERRNYYQCRMIDNEVNVIYFTQKFEESTPDTQERVDAKSSIEKAKESIANDLKLMEAFDILIDSLEKELKK